MRTLLPFVTLALLALPAGALEWRQLHPQGPVPSVRRGVSGLHDAGRGRLVFQGGETPDARFLADLWHFDLAREAWLRPGPEPDRRCHHSFLLDRTRGRALLFGGFPRTNRLWSWDPVGGSWTEITPAASPPQRCLHTSVIDERRGEMIVYGGLLGAFTPDLSDTWALDLRSDEWRVPVQDSPPGARYGHVAALDAARDRMIVFGGFVGSPAGSAPRDLDDLWAFDLVMRDWAPLQAANAGPTARQFARGAALPDGRGLILFGGLRDFVDVLDDLWLLDFESLRWIELRPAGARPPGRFRHTLVMSEDGRWLWVAFGEGSDGRHYNDIWELELTSLSTEPLAR